MFKKAKNKNSAILSVELRGDANPYNELENIKHKELVVTTLSKMADVTSSHGGNVVRTMENGMTSTFPNSKKAVQCAYEMHQFVYQDFTLSQSGMKIKIAFDYGAVTVEKKKISGTGVDVVAQLMSIVDYDQVFSTVETVRGLPAEYRMNVRTVDALRIPGASNELEACEMIWQTQEEGDVTIISQDRLQKTTSPMFVKLTLQHQGRRYELSENRPSFLVGRGDRNDLILKDTQVSRNHLTIQYEARKFRLQDQSANGTYVRTESKENFKIHQEGMLLRGKGIISLGKTISKENTDNIYYVLSMENKR